MAEDREDFDLEQWAETEWDSVEGVEVYFDSDGSADLYLMIDGEMVDYGTLDPGEVQEYIWEDLYWWADENEIQFDVEESYA